jgi:Ca2+-binding EF-hand superfamily protein
MKGYLIMNKFLIATALIGSFAFGSTAVLAEYSKGDKQMKMMERVDTDGNGVITKEEFMARHEEMFAKIDSDNDGSLTKEEMQTARQDMKKKWKEMKDKRQNMDDTNTDM